MKKNVYNWQFTFRHANGRNKQILRKYQANGYIGALLKFFLQHSCLTDKIPLTFSVSSFEASRIVKAMFVCSSRFEYDNGENFECGPIITTIRYANKHHLLKNFDVNARLLKKAIVYDEKEQKLCYKPGWKGILFSNYEEGKEDEEG